MVVNYPRISLERNPYSGSPIIVKANSVSAPPGNYILFVQAPGYVDYRAEIVLKGPQVYHDVLLRQAHRPAAR